MIFAIFGAGGCGRDIAPVAQRMLDATSSRVEIVFVSDFAEPILNGRRLLRLDEVPTGSTIVIAVADPRHRRAIAARCQAQGLVFGDIVAPDHERYDNAEVGEGGMFSAGTIANSNIRIGRHFHCNMNSYIAHDSVIGDFVTFGPNVGCNGAVTVGDDVYVGAGALLKPGVKIGAGATVGMGAVVVRDVAAGETVVGNPAQPIRQDGRR